MSKVIVTGVLALAACAFLTACDESGSANRGAPEPKARDFSAVEPAAEESIKPLQGNP
jgi:hypothetical protein